MIAYASLETDSRDLGKMREFPWSNVTSFESSARSVLKRDRPLSRALEFAEGPLGLRLLLYDSRRQNVEHGIRMIRAGLSFFSRLWVGG